MSTCYDIDFLSEAAPKLERHAIYFYQAESRALRKRVRDRVLELYETKAFVPRGVQAKGLQEELALSSLFPTVLVCDLEEVPTRQVRDVVARVLDELPNCDQPLFLLVPCEPPESASAAECTILVEPIVTTETIQLVFDFCLRESTALSHVQLTNQHVFRRHLASVVAKEPMSLWEFSCLFDRLAITAINGATGHFATNFVADNAKQEEVSLGLALEAFVLSDADNEALREMLLYVTRFLHQRHRAAPVLVSRIQELTCRVLGLSRADANMRRRALTWSALLLAWDAWLLQGPFENAFLELCQRYRESGPKRDSLPALEGRWREIAESIARYRPADSGSRPQLTRLLDHMATELESFVADDKVSPRWLRRLRSLFYVTSINPAEFVPPPLASVPADWRQRDAPHTFRSILGQDQALSAMMKHLEHGVGQHIIFTGPPGVGKRTLARLYAMAMWCKQRDATGSPCGACESCLGVLTNNAIDFLEVDFAQSPVGVASSVEATMVVPLQVDQRVSALFNIERIPPAQLDQLLKVLEQVQNAVFLFTVADASLMNAAVLSRCRVVPVLPLAPHAALGRLQSVCTREGVAYELDALRIVADVSRCRAGALLHDLVSVAVGGPVSLVRARNVFGLDWVPAVVSRLAAGLQSTEVSASQASDVLDDEFVERAQLVMTAADLRRKGVGPQTYHGLHPAFICLAADWDLPLQKSLETRAAKAGISAEHIWNAFVETWLNMDFCVWSELELPAQ